MADAKNRPVPVVLDCDPGHDDAIAILLAYAHPGIDLRAITTVAGNQTVEKCTLNARRIATLAGITDVPIAEGSAAPLKRPLRVADHIHGASGLDGFEFGEPTVPAVDTDAVELTYDIVRSHAEPVTLVAVGPLTNVAWLLRKHPEVKDAIAEVVVMGGSTERGNASPYAESNIYVDPEAADEVWRSEMDLTMVGLNVTHHARCTRQLRQRMRAKGGAVGTTCAALMEFYATQYQQRFGFDAPPLHDPIAVARVIDPTVVDCVTAPVVVETAGDYTAGATVVDLHHRLSIPDNTQVAMQVDVSRFWDLVIEAVGSYD